MISVESEKINLVSGRIRTLLICVVLAGAVFVAFEGVRKNGLVNYDDKIYLTDNLQVREGLSFESVLWAFTTWHAGYWHPLTWVSHMLDCTIFGLEPAGHHLVNLGFHIANVILLFLILKRVTGAFWRSFFVAAVFGLHPLAVESVAWLAERKNILSTFFAFLTIAAYIRYSHKRGLWWYLMVVVLFAAGLSAKPMLVTLPFVLILLDYWPLSRIDSKFSILNSFYEKLPLMAISAVLCVATYMGSVATKAMIDIVTLPLKVRIFNVLVSYTRYIWKVFYPVSLAVLYPLDFDGPALWQAGVCLLVLVLVSFLAVILRRKYGWLFTGWFWYLGILVPVIGIIQVGGQSMADRYMYLPGIGVYIIIVWIAGNAAAKFRLSKIFISAAGAVILAALLVFTRVQVEYWRDSLLLFGRAIAVTENNYIMHNSLGSSLIDRGRLDEAIEHLKMALDIKPDYAMAHLNLGYAMLDKGMPTEALAEFERTIAIDPNFALAHNNCGVALSEIGLYDEAIEHFSKALSLSRYFSGGFLGNLCRAGIKAGKLDDVLDVIEDWKLKKPDGAELYYWAGIIYWQKGDKDKATEQLDEAMKLAESQGSKELIAKIKEKLEQYRQANKAK